MKLGGVTLNNAGFIANALKQKASELDLRERIEPVARKLLLSEYAKKNLNELAPNYRTSLKLDKGGKMTYLGKREDDASMENALNNTNINTDFAGIF